jgi:hypothetical protein
MSDNKTEIRMTETPPKIKLGEVFEVEGRLYAIQIPATSSQETRLDGGRDIFEFFYMQE